MRLLTFLRDVGRHARMGAMLSKDSVRTRMEGMEGGMSYTEFTYQLLQGYDFVHMHREYGVRVQVRGAAGGGGQAAGFEFGVRACCAKFHTTLKQVGLLRWWWWCGTVCGCV